MKVTKIFKGSDIMFFEDNNNNIQRRRFYQLPQRLREIYESWFYIIYDKEKYYFTNVGDKLVRRDIYGYEKRD